MALRRLRTQTASVFTAAEAQALDGIHDVMRTLTAIRGHGTDLIELFSHANLSGPALDSAAAAISGFVSEWGPKAAGMESAAQKLVRQVGDEVVKARRTRVRG